jgi:uncharacterized damage-inducible protein DinB
VNPTGHPRPEPKVSLHTDEALELAGVLSTLEDWLLHTSGEVLDELASFAYRHSYHPRGAVEALIDYLGHTSVNLTRHTTATTTIEETSR